MRKEMMAAVLSIVSTAMGAVNTSTTVDNRGISASSTFGGYQSLVDRDYTGGQRAYDYSVHLIRTGEETGSRHRAFIGGRWKSSYGDGDHILQWTSPYGAANTWSMWYNNPEYWLGYEEGYPNQWWSGNTMDPEVLYSSESGWIMYVQVEIQPGTPVDYGGTAAVQADRIMLLTGGPNYPWTKWTQRGVVTNISDPTRTMLHHHEVLYVPWDKDGKKFWLYAMVAINGTQYGYYRFRSSDYTTFDYNQREATSGLSQIGNQMGYLQNAPGAPLFTRITFVTYNNRTVPALQFSKDGLNWTFGSNGQLRLEGSSDNNKNKNCYFLGLATYYGQGAINSSGTNQWNPLYAATTSNSPTAPDIYYAEIGVGTLTLTVDAFRKPDIYCVDRTGSATDVHILARSSDYTTFSSQVATALGQTTSNYVFAFGDYNNDFVDDMFIIHKNNTPSGKTELHVLSGADNFQTYLLHTATILHATDDNWQFDVGDFNRDNYLDLYCINRQGATKTEVHVLSGAANYSAWLQQTSTALGKTDLNWSFALADYNKDQILDLYCINKQGSTATEVHVLNGSGGYQSYLVQKSTLLGKTNGDWSMDIGDYNNDGIPDLYAIRRQNTASGKTEVHVVNGNGFNAWLLQKASALSTVDADWSFYVRK